MLHFAFATTALLWYDLVDIKALIIISLLSNLSIFFIIFL